MRIIAGTLGGRVYNAPKNHRTHPMSDRVRGGLFNALGSLEGLYVLDAFAGSGALSFEAVSRGAKKVLAIESDRIAVHTITKNLQQLELGDSIAIVHASVQAWLKTRADEQFDIILCDPPYDRLQEEAIKALSSLVKAGGLLVLSWPGRQEPLDLSPLQAIRTASYGDAQLVFYRAV